MKDLGIKSKVLKEIMDLMDQKEGDRLKAHPKLVAMKVTTASPLEKVGSAKDMKEDELEKEPSDVEGLEQKLGSDVSEEIDPETLAQLMKLIK